MIQKLAAEFLGTFFFIAVILFAGHAIPIGIALAVCIFMTATISGGNLNPAVSTVMFAKGALDGRTYTGYVVSQILGGLLALVLYRAVESRNKANA